MFKLRYTIIIDNQKMQKELSEVLNSNQLNDKKFGFI